MEQPLRKHDCGTTCTVIQDTRIALLCMLVALLPACDEQPTRTAQEHLNEATELLDSGDLGAAIIELKNAIALEPGNSLTRLLLARAYIETGNGAGAEKELRRSFSHGMPANNIAILVARAMLLQHKSRELLALGDFFDGSLNRSELRPRDRAELTALEGHAHLQRLEIDAADKNYNRALTLDPDSIEARVGKAALAIMQGRTAEAKAW